MFQNLRTKNGSKSTTDFLFSRGQKTNDPLIFNVHLNSLHGIVNNYLSRTYLIRKLFFSRGRKTNDPLIFNVRLNSFYGIVNNYLSRIYLIRKL